MGCLLTNHMQIWNAAFESLVEITATYIPTPDLLLY